MKKILIITTVAVLTYLLEQGGISLPSDSSSNQIKDSTLQTAYKNRQSNVQVQNQGVVIRILPDDLKGSRHQKFIIKLAQGPSILIAHNIDLAPRISDLSKGDTVGFYGEYEWNSRGGVVHWTHDDPAGNHIDGWLKHNGKTYQ